MPAPISVVIPTRNAEADLPGALAALMEGLQAGLIRELVISDAGSTDATRRIAEEAGARHITGAPGRGGQIARGVAAAQAPWILILHADSWLAPGWAEVVASHMNASGNRAGYFRLSFRAQGLAARLVAGWANLRAWLFGLPYGDQGLLVRRDVLAEAGGVPDIPLMEDVAMARALRGRLVAMDARIQTSAERYLAEGWGRRGARNLMTIARYLLGADPAALARSYDRSRSGNRSHGDAGPGDD